MHSKSLLPSLLLLTTFTYAQGPGGQGGPPPRPTLLALDTNKDGVLSKAEFAAGAVGQP